MGAPLFLLRRPLYHDCLPESICPVLPVRAGNLPLPKPVRLSQFFHSYECLRGHNQARLEPINKAPNRGKLVYFILHVGILLKQVFLLRTQPVHQFLLYDRRQPDCPSIL